MKSLATKNINTDDKMTIADLNDFMENSDKCKIKRTFVTEIANTIIENLKHEEQRQLDLEKIKFESVNMNQN